MKIMNNLFNKIKMWLYWFSFSTVTIRKCNDRKERDGCSGKFRRLKQK